MKKNDGFITRFERRFHPLPIRKFFLFGVVGGLGTVLNTGLLYLFHSVLGMQLLLSSAIATETAVISNFFGNHLLTFRKSTNDSPLWKKFLTFQAISLIALTLTVGALWLMVMLLGEGLYLLWNIVAILIAFSVNFSLNHRFTWAEKTGKRTKA
jgi:putative flippase GtrA